MLNYTRYKQHHQNEVWNLEKEGAPQETQGRWKKLGYVWIHSLTSEGNTHAISTRPKERYSTEASEIF